MKQYGKFFRTAALTAAVCLRLSQSVWAMPTGGAAVDPASVTIDQGTLANPTSGATIATVGGAAIINWEAFGIASGEALSFNTANGALLNRVTGGNLSEIYGTLHQTGDNPMFLVNPAGITVGSTGVIDANNLVLSTLAMSDSQFQNAVSSGIAEFGDGAAPGPLVLEEGATVNINQMLAALGGTVTVADGVTFSVGDDVELVAANKVSALVGDAAKNADYRLGSDAFRPVGISAASDNVLSVGESTIKTNDLAFLAGGAVNLQGTTVKSGNVDVLAAASGKTVDSVRGQNGADVVYTMGADNAITLANATLTGDGDANIIGGKVDISGSKVEQNAVIDYDSYDSYDDYIQAVEAAEDTAANLDIAALGEYTNYADGDVGYRPLDASHALTLKDTAIGSPSGLFMGAGKIALNNTKVSAYPDLLMFAGTNFDNQHATADEGNTIAIANGSEVFGSLVDVMGSSVDITDSSVTGGHIATVTAFKTMTRDIGEYEYEVTEAVNPPGEKEQLARVTKVGTTPYISCATAGPGNTVTMSHGGVDGHSVQVFGGKIDLEYSGSANYSTPSLKKQYIRYMAAPGFVSDGENVALDFSNAAGSSSDYVIRAKGGNICVPVFGDLFIGAGKVTLDDVEVFNHTEFHYPGQGCSAIYAVDNVDNDGMTTTSANMIELIGDRSYIEGGRGRMDLVAGQISVTGGSSIDEGRTEGNTYLVANDKIGFKSVEGVQGTVPYGVGTKGTIAVSADSTIGENVILDGTRTTPEPTPTPQPQPQPQPEPQPQPQPEPQPQPQPEPTPQPQPEPTPEPEPKPTPEPTPTPEPAPAPTPSIPEDVLEAYSEGMVNMQVAISGAADQAARERATRSLVESVNQGTGSDRAKAAAISGMMIAILQDHSLTDSEKISLQVEVVNNFAPMKQAKAEADNTVTGATQEANNALTNQPAAEVAQPGAASEESTIRGL